MLAKWDLNTLFIVKVLGYKNESGKTVALPYRIHILIWRKIVKIAF